MRLSNFWFDLPFALAGLLSLVGACFAGHVAASAVLLFMSGAYFWMSVKHGTMYRSWDTRRRKRREREAISLERAES